MATVEPFKLYTDTEIEEMEPPPWLIEGIIPQGALVECVLTDGDKAWDVWIDTERKIPLAAARRTERW